MQSRELAFISPGQGPAIVSAWKSDPAAENVITSVQRAVPDIDVGEMLAKSPSEREINVLNAHILLSVMMGIAATRLKPELKGRGYVVIGHSAGLPNSLGMTDFFRDGVEGLGRAMIERGKLLTDFNLSQVHHPVKFQKTIEFMVKKLEVEMIIELGSRYFAGIISKMDLGIKTISVRNPKELDVLVSQFAHKEY